ncbi:sulfatase [Tautonia sociabilis]|uniref:Aryl-sulfate sulfohydrolase n=1 Tax=Tautonia sociabilis TaxID=2080755 RepID=A0A432MKT0_9BACT|nr:sulfatase [Tautonia sociabilis]RUL87688.1 aryl-sulfate sulfohydrolase [Tautonia sociabilis]
MGNGRGRGPWLAVILAVAVFGEGAGISKGKTGPLDDRPNVVFILADDLGWTDLHCFGSGYYRTPNLDRLAAEGMVFRAGYSCGPNCQPTRAALMSGQYGPRTGVYTVGSRDRFAWRTRPLEPPENVLELDPGVVTVAEALKAAGYVTGIFGKWHLGKREACLPPAQGFDEAIISQGKHFDFETTPPVAVPEGTYLADFLTDRAVDFIERHADEPFFLYLPHFVVHSPIEAKEDLIRRFRSLPRAGGHRNPTYAAMIASLDESVGRVLEAIDEEGIRDRTLVIFSSDNGGGGGYEAAGISGIREVTTNAPLRSGKGSLYEGGIRVPWIFRWPGTIAAGSESVEPILSVDLYPTLLELAGGDPPAGQPLDGENLVPMLTGKADSIDRPALFWHFPGYLGAGQGQWRTTPVSVIRSGDLKLLQFLEHGTIELYDLARDLGESRNLAGERPEEVKRLLEELDAWRARVGAPLPGPNREGESR